MTIRFRLSMISIILLAMSMLVGCTPGTITSSPTIGLPSTTLSRTVSPDETHAHLSEPVSITATSTSLPEVTTITPTSPTAEPSLQLTFISDHHGVYELNVNCLETVKPCLDEPQLLFEWEDWISAIDWSPDGNRVAIISGRYGGKLFVAEWNGDNAAQITSTCGAASWPQWSPDGLKIAFIYSAGRPGCEVLEPAQIQVYDLETGQMTPIFSNAYDPNRIYWLPDGELAYIAKISETDWTEMINIVKPDGSFIKQLPANATDFTDIFDLAYSPDSKYLAFVGEINPSTGRTTRDIYVLDIDEHNMINLTTGLGNNFEPVWSPVGDWIAFESDRGGDFQIYLIQSNGSGLFQINTNSASGTSPAWRISP
jgi:dipeptidyl aminopeptidase/acylaminoacyl peptidase